MPSRLRSVGILLCGAAVLLAALSGCGDDQSAAPEPPKTVTDLMLELATRARARDTAGVLALLSPDARNQSGKQWLDYIGRTGGPMTVAAVRAIPAEELKKMDALPTDQFVKKLNELAPRGFATLFDLYYVGDFEEGGRVLVYVTNDRGTTAYLAMERGADGTLKLLGEAESQKVFEALRNKLNDKLRKAPAA